MYEDFVPDRLAQLRMKKNVSARDMSLTIGQSENYINQIENHRSLPSMQVFFYICEYLKVTPQQFFDEHNPNPVFLSQLLTTLGQLDDDTLAHILAIAEKLPKQKARRRG